MIFGDPSIVAIESVVSKAYWRRSFFALGCFLIHIRGRCYGVRSTEATMLGCSVSEVEKRIKMRGQHIAQFAHHAKAHEIATAFRRAFYEDGGERETFFGYTVDQFRAVIYGNRILWAPDGDEAFDDGSYVLQFDFEERVRVIAFKSPHEIPYSPASVGDVWLDAADFYSVLETWREAIEREWESAEKLSG